MSSIPVPLKTRRVRQRCTLNLWRVEEFAHWCGVVVRRGGARSGVVHVTKPWFKTTWSVAKNPRVAEHSATLTFPHSIIYKIYRGKVSKMIALCGSAMKFSDSRPQNIHRINWS
ncbi:uncharacterized protein TNCV_4839531 [Trichonephila clavipes]|nr:uncharacterized protein TNCV_4839531 [Trichonephila clavipes]